MLPAQSIMENHLQDKSALIYSRINERTVVCCRKLCPRTFILNILFYFVLGMIYESVVTAKKIRMRFLLQ